MGNHSDPRNQTPKASLHQKKAMLSIWRDWKKILYSEFLLPSGNINSNVYCQQLDKLKKKIEKKKPRIDQPEGRRLPSRQRTTSHFFEDPEKTERARLGSFTISTILPRSCSFELSPF